METIWRVIFVYAFVWICFRVVGKRELSQMAPFELVMLLVFPQLFSRALTRQDYSMTNAVIGATTLFLLVFISSTINYRFRRVRQVWQSAPTVLVAHGQYRPHELDRERIASSEIYSAMHKIGIEDLHDVEWAILEGDGRIAIIPRQPMRMVSSDGLTGN